MAKPKHKNLTPVIENRRARHDYHIGETLEVGIVLLGSEVKAVRDSNVSIGEGYVTATEEPLGLALHSVNIGPYGPAGPLAHPPVRVRELLAHKREIRKLAKAVAQKGATIVPLKMYFKDGFAKVLIGVGVGKSNYDKRESIAQRESDRDIQRAMSKRMKG